MVSYSHTASMGLRGPENSELQDAKRQGGCWHVAFLTRHMHACLRACVCVWPCSEYPRLPMRSSESPAFSPWCWSLSFQTLLQAMGVALLVALASFAQSPECDPVAQINQVWGKDAVLACSPSTVLPELETDCLHLQPQAWRVDTGGPREPVPAGVAEMARFRFSDRPCFGAEVQRVAEEDTRCLALATACLHGHKLGHTRTHVPHISEKERKHQSTALWHRLPGAQEAEAGGYQVQACMSNLGRPCPKIQGKG